MSSPANPSFENPRPASGRWAGGCALIIGVLVGVLVAASIGLFLMARASGRGLSHLWTSLTSRSLTIDVRQPTVVEHIQRLQRLETVTYTMDKIVTGAKENPIFPDFLAGDRLLMLVHGEVVAGIDFTSLKPGDVRLAGKLVHLHLPGPQVFSTRLDSGKTRVYSRQTGFLVQSDPNLETQVRQEAERQLLEAAMAEGILHTAQQNGMATLTSLLQGLGFERVEFE